VSWYF